MSEGPFQQRCLPPPNLISAEKQSFLAVSLYTYFAGKVSLFVPVINSSSFLRASSSEYWIGGDFIKQAEGATSVPLNSLSLASLQHLIASITTPAELGLSQ